jgi:hypothetical protein
LLTYPLIRTLLHRHGRELFTFVAEHVDRQLKARAAASQMPGAGMLGLRKSSSSGRRVSAGNADPGKATPGPTKKFCAEEARLEELLYEVLRHITFSHDAMRYDHCFLNSVALGHL